MQSERPTREVDADVLAQYFTKQNYADIIGPNDLFCQASNFPSLVDFTHVNEYISFDLPLPSIVDIDRSVGQFDHSRINSRVGNECLAKKHPFENITNIEQPKIGTFSQPKINLKIQTPSEKPNDFSLNQNLSYQANNPFSKKILKSHKPFDLNEFECKMENDLFGKHFHFDRNMTNIPHLVFVKRQHSESRIASEATVTLSEIIHLETKMEQHVKVYSCNICGQQFTKSSALGGHKAKTHPNSSPSYIARQRTYRIRKAEREKKANLMKL